MGDELVAAVTSPLPRWVAVTIIREPVEIPAEERVLARDEPLLVVSCSSQADLSEADARWVQEKARALGRSDGAPSGTTP